MPKDKISEYKKYKVRGSSKKFRLNAIEKTKKGATWWASAFKGEDSKIKVRTVKSGKSWRVYTYFDKSKPKRKTSKKKR
jgi:hypothetical protein